MCSLVLVWYMGGVCCSAVGVGVFNVGGCVVGSCVGGVCGWVFSSVMSRGVVERLCSVPGVGFVSAATVAAELGDVKRFTDEKSMCCYCGITPSVCQSGKKRCLLWLKPVFT